MGCFRSFLYTFNSNDKGFISDISLYNARIIIEAIQIADKILPNFKEISGKELPQFLKSIPANNSPITMRVRSAGNSGAYGVLPYLSTFVKNPYFLNATAAMLNRTNFTAVVDCIEKANNAWDTSYPSTPLESLDKASSFLLLLELSTKFNLQGAIHLPTLHKIIIQYASRQLIISYGEKAHFKYIDSGFLFNVRQGFRTFDLESTSLEDKAIVAELNSFFTKWQNKNYQGPVIPLSDSGFIDMALREIKNTAILMAQGKRCHNFFSNLPSELNLKIVSYLAPNSDEKEVRNIFLKNS